MDLKAFTKEAQEAKSGVEYAKKVLDTYTQKQIEWENAIRIKTDAWHDKFEEEFRTLLGGMGYKISGGKQAWIKGSASITIRAELRDNRFYLTRDVGRNSDVWSGLELSIYKGDKRLHGCFIEPKIISKKYKALPKWDIQVPNFYQSLTNSNTFADIRRYLDQEASADTADMITTILETNQPVLESNINALSEISIGSEVEKIGDIETLEELIEKL